MGVFSKIFPNYFAPINGALLNQLASFQNILNSQSGITALAGGALSSATPVLSYGLNKVTVCTSASDSVTLPNAKAGSICLVANPTGSTLAIFPALGTSDTINAGAAAASVTQATLIHALYFCVADGSWSRILSA